MFLMLAGLASLGCDQRVEPYVAGEQPDLSKISPAGVDSAPSADPIQGTITLAPQWVGKVPAGAVVFLIARSASAGPPLAVKRIEDPRFPLKFSIGADDRMIKSRPFAGEIHLSARLDADGNASTRSPGDLQSTAQKRYNPGDLGVSLTIDEALPAS